MSYLRARYRHAAVAHGRQWHLKRATDASASTSLDTSEGKRSTNKFPNCHVVTRMLRVKRITGAYLVAAHCSVCVNSVDLWGKGRGAVRRRDCKQRQ